MRHRRTSPASLRASTPNHEFPRRWCALARLVASGDPLSARASRGPTATGSVEERGGRLYGRLRLADGTRSPRFELPASLTREAATGYVGAMQAEESRTGAVLRAKLEAERDAAVRRGEGHTLETVDAWHVRFTDSRGTAEDRKNAGKWRKWISPVIGAMAMADVSREDIERVRDRLDEAQRAYREFGRGEGRLMPKTCANIWSLVTTAFKQAAASKDRTLRVRDTDPCTGVLPPDKGQSRLKAWLYPRELAALLACEAVPEQWRALYAVAGYTYLRPGELAELRVSDLDLESGLLSVTRAWEWDEKAVGPPKSRNGVRRVPFEPTLLPVLEALCAGKSAAELLFPWFRAVGENKAAGIFRVHLAAADVTASRLLEDSAARMPVGFRSLRDSGITWLALAGVPIQHMQRRAGHDDMNTTMGYVKEAEDLSRGARRAFRPNPGPLEGPSHTGNSRVCGGNRPTNWPKKRESS